MSTPSLELPERPIAAPLPAAHNPEYIFPGVIHRVIHAIVSSPAALRVRRCLFLALVLTGSAGLLSIWAGTVEFSHDSTQYLISVEELRSFRIRRACRDSTGEFAPRALEHMLDSLGYFEPRRDTSSVQRVEVYAGVRAQLTSLTIVADSLLLPDSLELPSLPCSYDAGVVEALAHDLLYHFAVQGYPFASASLDIDIRKPEAPDGTPRVPQVSVTVRVERGPLCMVGQVRFLGEFRTRRRQLAKDVRIVVGSRYDQRLVDESVRRLKARPYVAEVRAPGPRIRPRTGEDSLPVEPESTTVAVPLEVRDRAGLALDGAIGFEVGGDEETRLTGTFDFTLLNTLGVGERATLTYRGERNSQRLALMLAKTYVAHVPVFVEGGFHLEIERDHYAHFRGNVRGLYELSSPWRLGLGVSGEENTVTDTARGSSTWHVYGGELLLDRPPEPYRRREVSKLLWVRAGSALARRDEEDFVRWNVDFDLGVHFPLGRIQALAAKLVTRNLFTEETRLSRAELYRIGGYRSLRGYPDEAYAFRNAAYGQLEYLVYFTPRAAAYVFVDGGYGSRSGIEDGDEYIGMFGYGLGVRVPVRIGSATVEWARSIEDTRGFGRIHVRIRNSLARDAY